MTPRRAQLIARVGERRIAERRAEQRRAEENVASWLDAARVLQAENSRLRRIIACQQLMLDSHACEECGRGRA